MDGPESTITCVDPFLSITDNDHAKYFTDNTEKNFHNNVSLARNSEKLTLVKDRSRSFFGRNEKLFDIVYIDGSHQKNDVTGDVYNGFRYLKPGGLLWINNYRGSDRTIQRAAVEVLTPLQQQNRFTVLNNKRQLGIRKNN